MNSHNQKSNDQELKSLEFFKIYGISILLALAVFTVGRVYFESKADVVFEDQEVEQHDGVRSDLPEVGSVSAALLKQVKILINNKSF